MILDRGRVWIGIVRIRYSKSSGHGSRRKMGAVQWYIYSTVKIYQNNVKLLQQCERSTQY